MPRKIATGNKVQTLYSSIRQIIDEARSKIYRTAYFTMVQAYWQIGKLIVEEEQKGKGRAEYGDELIKRLSERLSLDYGKGFNETNLKYMRQFFQAFRKSHSLRDELSWTHYRLLL